LYNTPYLRNTADIGYNKINGLNVCADTTTHNAKIMLNDMSNVGFLSVINFNITKLPHSWFTDGVKARLEVLM